MRDNTSRLKQIEGRLDQVVEMFQKSQERLLKCIAQGREILMTQKETAERLTKVNEKLIKVGSETSKLLTTIDELKKIIADGSEVSAELKEAVDKVTAQADVVDLLVPDEPATP